MNARRKQQKNAQTAPVAPVGLTRSNILMLFQKQMRPAFRTIDKGRKRGYINFIIRWKNWKSARQDCETKAVEATQGVEFGSACARHAERLCLLLPKDRSPGGRARSANYRCCPPLQR